MVIATQVLPAAIFLEYCMIFKRENEKLQLIFKNGTGGELIPEIICPCHVNYAWIFGKANGVFYMQCWKANPKALAITGNFPCISLHIQDDVAVLDNASVCHNFSANLLLPVNDISGELKEIKQWIHSLFSKYHHFSYKDKIIAEDGHIIAYNAYAETVIAINEANKQSKIMEKKINSIHLTVDGERSISIGMALDTLFK